MALTPAAVDPNRKAELQRIKDLAKGPNGPEIVKNEFNMDLHEKTNLEVKDPEIPVTDEKPVTPKSKTT